MAGQKKIEGIAIDPEEITVAAAAVRAQLAGKSYMGINISSHISDEECRAFAAAVVTAIEKYRAAPSI